MYNGGILFRLSEPPPSDLEVLPEVAQAHTILSASPVVSHLAELRQQPTQLAIRPTLPLPHGLLQRFVAEALAAEATPPAVEVFSSGHSVDVISRNASKQRVVEAIRAEIAATGKQKLSVMTIGDQGQAGGNDAAFLAHALGLSVERVSSVMENCWNIAPRGSRRTTAMLRYLEALRPVRGGGFRLSVKVAAGLTSRALKGGEAVARVRMALTPVHESKRHVDEP
jgi:hypothetical protein